MIPSLLKPRRTLWKWNLARIIGAGAVDSRTNRFAMVRMRGWGHHVGSELEEWKTGSLVAVSQTGCRRSSMAPMQRCVT
jgi:hypothetical protein